MVTALMLSFSFFFFQAEDGIRDYKVTGVQTCALPIFKGGIEAGRHREGLVRTADQLHGIVEFVQQEIAHVAVRVVDDEAGRSRPAGTSDGGVRLGSHQPAGALVLRHATHHLVQVNHAGHAFQVDGEEDPVAFVRSRLRTGSQSLPILRTISIRLARCASPASIMCKSRSHPVANRPRDASIPSCSDCRSLKNRRAWETVAASGLPAAINNCTAGSSRSWPAAGGIRPSLPTTWTHCERICCRARCRSSTAPKSRATAGSMRRTHSAIGSNCSSRNSPVRANVEVGSWFRGAWNKNPTGKYRKVSRPFPPRFLRRS